MAGLQRCVALCAGFLALFAVASSASATVVWEDYRGDANAGSNYTGPAGRPTFGNYGSGNPIVNLRSIASNPANAVRTGSSGNIDFLSNTQLCNAYDAPNSTACGFQAMGRVSYALIRFPVAGTYTLSVAHDDNVDVDLSSDYANTSYRTASYNVAVGAVGDYTANDTTFAPLGTFTAAAANSCALIRMYWTNAGGLNFARLRWTRPSPTTTEIIPATQMFDPGVAASAVGCNGSISGNNTAVSLNKILGSPRAQAADQFTVQIGTTAAAGTVSEATTSGSAIGQQASTGAFPAVTGTIYYLRDLMAAGSASTLASAYTSNIACTRNGTPFTPAGSSPTWNVTPAANDQIVCNITNTARPILRLQKSLPGGRVLSADQFALAIAGPGAGAGASVTTTGTGNTPTQVAAITPATAGSAYAFSETAAAGANLANYVTAYACTNTLPGGQAPGGSGASFSVTPVAGDNLTCTFSNTAIVPPDFGTCDARMYLSQAPDAVVPTPIYSVNTSSNPFAFPLLGTGTFAYNGIGYHPTDNYVYAMRAATNELLRIGSDGSTVSLGVVTGLPVASYLAGEIGPDGTFYVLAATTSTLYAINVATRTAVARSLSASVTVPDIAWVGGLLYGVENSAGAIGQLRSINPTTGAVTNIGAPVTGTGAFGAMYGSPTGLYGNSNSGSGFYRFDLSNGARTVISSSPGASSNDGAHCVTAPIQFAADIDVTKTDGQTVYTPGTNVTYTIVVRNSGPFGVQNATISDPLPTGITTASWTCIGAGGGTCTASGSGAIGDTVNLPVDATATYTLILTVPAGRMSDLVNIVTVGSPAGTTDPTPGNNTASDTDTQNSQADLSITKASTPNGPFTPGQTISYAITATNNGPSAADGATVYDPVAAGLDCTAITSCTPAGGAACPGAPTVSGLRTSPGLVVPTLPNGGSVQFVLSCQVTATGQ